MAKSGLVNRLMCGLALALAANCASAAQYTDDPAVPDFSSGERTWVLATPQEDITSFGRLPGDTGPGPISDLAGYHYVQNESNRISDTEHPLLQPWAREVLRRGNETVLAGGVPFVNTSRCWPEGVPGLLLSPGQAVIYLQAPGQVWIVYARDSQLRRIYLDVEHSEKPPYTAYGESVGHYENGDTLAIDTIALAPTGPIDRWRTPHTKQLHVAERHQLMNDDQNIQVVFTVDDPGAFTAPWHGMVQFARGRPPRSDRFEETICNENATEFFVPEEGLVPSPRDDTPDF